LKCELKAQILLWCTLPQSLNPKDVGFCHALRPRTHIFLWSSSVISEENEVFARSFSQMPQTTGLGKIYFVLLFNTCTDIGPYRASMPLQED
jgi:hypothetical protein